MSVAERVLGAWRVQRLAEMEEWTALNAVVEETWGWFPALTLVNALGLLVVAFANSRAVAGAWGAEVLFWLGLLIMLIPSAMRLVEPTLARRERIAIVVGLSLAFYLVKVLHSPFAFTYGDEFFHLFNTNQILQTGVLFTENPVLQVSPMFPGLASVTAALATLTGLPVLAAGLIVIGVARLVLFLAFYLFTEQVSCSPRVAALATLFYMGNATFLFWNAQFAYESLALPLAIGVFYLIARREGTAERTHHLGLSVLALLGISAVVITHHLTSYVVATFLLVWTLFVQARVSYWLTRWHRALFLTNKGKLSDSQLSNLSIWSQRSEDEQQTATTEKPAEGPQGLAIFALIAALAWLIYVAVLTINYLSPVISKGVFAMLQLIFGEGQGRPLFVSNTGYVAPLWERIVGIGAVVLSLSALPFGLAQIWQRTRTNPPALLLALAGVGYFAVLGLRLTTASWQLGNRASTYLFVGLAFVLAMAVERLWAGRWQSRQSRGLFAVALAVIFTGGVIAGWEPQLRLTQPYVVATGQTTVETTGLAVAQWMHDTLGPGHVVAADEANGRYMLAYGEQYPYVGRHPFVREILTEPTVNLPQSVVMAEWGLEYVVVDRRLVAWDTMGGYFFNRPTSQPEAGWFAPEVYQKFDQQESVNRIMDSGDVVIYEVGALSNE
ncbi:MAG: hypothetical protein R3E79_09335 [Caldilineaceae bacterium]